jgi:porphobilinogen synthase
MILSTEKITHFQERFPLVSAPLCAKGGFIMSFSLPHRPRRLRRNPANRALARETRVQASDLIYPLFLCEGPGKKEPILTLPGQFRWSVDTVVDECARAHALGIRAVNLFGSSSQKSPMGESASDPDGIVPRAIRALKNALPSLCVQSDVALDPYTSHGHDGLLHEGEIDNDATLVALQHMALVHAEAGADWVSPSDMMDGRVGAIRHFLDLNGHNRVSILSYTAKYASCFYGPFRGALDASPLQGPPDKRSYQMDPANRREALREAALDAAEGADALMVKPAGYYLDVLHELKRVVALPVAAYQVSGEYAMIHAAAEKGWIPLEAAMRESLLCIKRAGADMILTYFAPEMAQSLQRSPEDP